MVTLGSPFPASPAGPRLPGAAGHLPAAPPERGGDAHIGTGTLGYISAARSSFRLMEIIHELVLN